MKALEAEQEPNEALEKAWGEEEIVRVGGALGHRNRAKITTP
jgi:hypothetical protein